MEVRVLADVAHVNLATCSRVEKNCALTLVKASSRYHILLRFVLELLKVDHVEDLPLRSVQVVQVY